MSTSKGAAERSGQDQDEAEIEVGRPRLRLVAPAAEEPRRGERSARAHADEQGLCDPPDDAGTTTAEYTVVTGAAVAFGALLFKLLTSSWGNKILGTAFKHVIALLGF